MDCIVFKHPSVPRIFTSSRSSFGSSQIVGVGHYRKRQSPNLKSAGDSFVESNQNGSVFETLSAEITPETIDFFVSEAEGDPDCPSKGYSSIGEVLAALSEGKVSTGGSGL
ncbi:hypothetical protein K7X08_032090 [Anisodus acutangulus]|uniref:Uncharacterized protein n=1 Tax=Anisodus acutangulus TaxID=402998 RepID=A0A9Q1MMK4_9SOLA|nr:hypothetical protein K7X08_032090 [Anisodus acutangulus]